MLVSLEDTQLHFPGYSAGRLVGLEIGNLSSRHGLPYDDVYSKPSATSSMLMAQCNVVNANDSEPLRGSIFCGAHGAARDIYIISLSPTAACSVAAARRCAAITWVCTLWHLVGQQVLHS